MATRTLHIPAESLQAAMRIAHAVDAGRVPCLDHYLDEARAKAAAAAMTAVHHERHAVYSIHVVDHVTDDGRIRVAKLAEAVVEIAAAFTLVVILPALAARFWGAFA